MRLPRAVRPIVLLLFAALLLAPGGAAGEAAAQTPAPPGPGPGPGPDSEPVTVGAIRYRPPAGWRLDAESGLWTKPGGTPGAFFSWAGPLPAGPEPLERQLAPFHRALEKELAVVRASEPRPLEARAPLRAIALARELRASAGGGAVYTFEALYLAGGSLHYFIFGAPSVEAYQAILEGEAMALLASVEAAPAGDWGEPPSGPAPDPGWGEPPPAAGGASGPGGGPLAARPFDGPTRKVERFCFSLEVPAAWPEDESSSAYLFVFQAKRATAAGREVTIPVVCEVQVGRVDDPRAALEGWLGGRMRALAKHELMDPERPVDRRQPGAFSTFRLATTGYAGAALTIDEQAGGALASTLAGAVVHGDGCALFIGTAIGVAGALADLPKAERDAVIAAFGAVGSEMDSVASHVRFALPARRPDAEALLARKGTYRYFYEYSSGGPSGFFVVKTQRVEWTFRPDGTCDLAQKDYFGINDSRYDPYQPGRLTGFTSVRLEGETGEARKRYEVRGASEKDLWILVSHGTGLTTFHRLEPAAEKKFGVYKPRGLAIDGLVEGKYSKGDGFQVYEPPAPP